MTDLILDSLEIQNFRAFRHLKIERLGRVNLITGKNNVGKTCLLEALWLYVRRGDVSAIRESLQTRNEHYDFAANKTSVEEQIEVLRQLFHGREDVRYEPKQISIGPLISHHKTLFLSVKWRTSMVETDDQGLEHLLPGLEGERPPVDRSYLGIRLGDKSSAMNLFGMDHDPFLRPGGLENDLRGVSIPSWGVSERQLGRLWDDVTLTQYEENVAEALRIIAPNVERLGMRSAQGSGIRIPIAKLKDVSSPIPLRSMGEGMSRLLSIALALVNAKDGALLVDEVETGLHYSVLPDVWKLIFEVSHRLNVQVFATTHSWDCITAFQEAAQNNADDEGLLIRLENRDGEVTTSGTVSTTVFDERKLAIAAREHIEVR